MRGKGHRREEQEGRTGREEEEGKKRKGRVKGKGDAKN